jgi:hypothetical protein
LTPSNTPTPTVTPTPSRTSTPTVRPKKRQIYLPLIVKS